MEHPTCAACGGLESRMLDGWLGSGKEAWLVTCPGCPPRVRWRGQTRQWADLAVVEASADTPTIVEGRDP